MACPAPFDALRMATEYLGPTLYKKAQPRSIWLNLIPREDYPQGIGLVQSVFTIGRSLPTTDEPEFTVIETSDGETFTGTCGNTYNDVSVGFNETTFGPEQFAWKGPIVCQDDLIYNFQASAFWGAYIPSMAKNTEVTISNRLASIYAHYAPRAVANEDFHTVAGDTGAPGTAPVLDLDESLCELNQEMLDQTAIELIQNGATDPNSDGWISEGRSGPLFTLYIGMDMSHRLDLDNAEIREDFRSAFMGDKEASPLLRRLGASMVIRNFRHVINLFPPRYSYNGTNYIRVPTWIAPSGTKGTIGTINPNYLSASTAPYEGAYVLTPWVFHSQVIKPVNSAAGMNWSPKNYMGEWTFRTGGSKIIDPPCYDPEDKLGRHFASFKHAPKPVFPEYGRLLIYKRCPADSFPCTLCS